MSVIGISFLTYAVAATSAANVSFIDSVKVLFGIETFTTPSKKRAASARGGIVAKPPRLRKEMSPKL